MSSLSLAQAVQSDFVEGFLSSDYCRNQILATKVIALFGTRAEFQNMFVDAGIDFEYQYDAWYKSLGSLRIALFAALNYRLIKANTSAFGNHHWIDLTMHAADSVCYWFFGYIHGIEESLVG